VIRCVNEQDALEAVNYGNRKNMLIAARWGGNNVVGFGTCSGGLVIDPSK
jgi:hypothetical protein